MRAAYLSIAVVVGLNFAIAAQLEPKAMAQKPVSVAQQGFAQDGLSQDVTGTVSPAITALFEPGALPGQLLRLTRANGQPLGCDEIRALDEVEWIADESYCE